MRDGINMCKGSRVMFVCVDASLNVMKNKSLDSLLNPNVMF